MSYNIKPLQWKGREASCLGYVYEIVKRRKGEQLLVKGHHGRIESRSMHASIPEAKYAADQDWGARIQEALSPADIEEIRVTAEPPKGAVGRCVLIGEHEGRHQIVVHTTEEELARVSQNMVCRDVEVSLAWREPVGDLLPVNHVLGIPAEVNPHLPPDTMVWKNG